MVASASYINYITHIVRLPELRGELDPYLAPRPIGTYNVRQSLGVMQYSFRLNVQK